MKQYAPAPVEFDAPVRVAVVRAQWNSHITSVLADGAVNTLEAAGAEAEVFEVPGAVELTFAAQSLIDTERYDAVIVFGCVIKGDTPHFDYVCQSVTQGTTMLNARGGTPVIFGLITTENMQQALDRAGGRLGNKGSEAAAAAIAMANLHHALQP